MGRRASIFVAGRGRVPQGVRTLLELNGVEYVEVDVSTDPLLRERIFAAARERVLPIVELDGTYVAGIDIVRLAHALKLKLTIYHQAVPQSCC